MDVGSRAMQEQLPRGSFFLNLMTGNERKDVGRNKPVRALSAGLAYPAFRLPETSTLAIAGRTYSGLRLFLSVNISLIRIIRVPLPGYKFIAGIQYEY
jgi:hypothetical protein